ncbi:PREDICTED: transcription factor GTE10 isoform X2 [Tarenaya hassleriana]|uniref:transcription factor GTE10 isoform X2 n=1 Tax=Tarenaya hassleriana TaxID=28532 RepID=UPI00053C1EA6|nr:PREDICTED: transcription factor GTE10 isoform X2 [Tarenaya hassleriana]
MAPAIPVNFLGQKEPKKFLALETMGKARKYSKGQSPRFVPDYRHAVENTVESEGFGYTGGMDTEMTLSDDSCAQKRKHISLNGDGRGVPKEVVPLSKLSRFERKDLICKLKIDLERVQDLHRKLASMNSDVVLVSPRSDIHSCSDGPRRLLPERSGRSVGKKRGALRTNMPRSKKGPSGRSQSVSTSFSLAQVMKQCEALLKSLISHQYGWPFHVPVDPVQLKIPDYFTIIKRPMDFGTIKTKLCKGEYSSPLDFVADVRLTLSNSMTYNPPGNEYHFMAQALSKYFETRWKSIEKKIPMVEPSIPPLNGTASAAVIQSKLKMEPANLVMTDEDKKKLRRELEALEEDIPENIADFLRQQSASAGQSGEEEIEIDIDDLSDEILFKLRGLLDDYMTEKKKSQEKSELCEMEIVHDLGLSNSPAQPSKGDGVIDEDVDIVSGNDPPVSIYPPLKMEKDASCRNNEGTSSSSSSSESGSSSSGSCLCEPSSIS